MAGKTIVGTEKHERALRWMKNEVQSIKNRMGYTFPEAPGGTYEPALGNPVADGYMLVSTAAGVRSWLDSATYSLAGHDHDGDYDPAGEAAGEVAAHELTYDHDKYDTAYGWGDHAGLYAPIAGAHAAVTLAASAGVLLGLSTQELSLDTQAANLIFAGPASGAAAAPTFRAMVAADLGTTLSPTFAGLDITGLTDGYIPYVGVGALADSPLRTTTADMGMGCAPTTGTRLTVQATSACEATLGAEMLTNGDFATNDFTGWTAGANWAAGTGAAVHTAGSAETLVQSVALTNGIYYQVSFVVVRSAGSVTVTFGDLEGSYAYTTAGTKTVSFTATATAAKDLTFTPSSDFAGSIDSVSVKAITANVTPALDIKSSAGTSMVPIRASATLYNLGIGVGCLANNTTGNYNVASGGYALYANTEGQYNVALGYFAGRYKAATISDKLFIDDRDRTNESGEQTLGLIYGGFAATTASQFLRINANVGIKTHTFGTSADGVLAIATGTAPSDSPADEFQVYSADIAAGNAAPHFRTENGAVIKLYQVVDADFANVPNSGDADTDDLINKMRDALVSHGLIASA